MPPSQKRSVWFLMCALTLVVVVRPAVAVDTGLAGLNIEFYQPRMDSRGFFGVNGPEMPRPGEFYFNLNLSYAHNHLFELAIDSNSLPTVEDFVLVDLVDNMVTTEFTASVGINPFLSAGLAIPWHPYLRETNFASLDTFTNSAMGDLNVSLKIRLLTETDHRPALALLFSTTFPTGSEALFTGTDSVVPTLDFLIGKKFKYASIAGNFGLSLLNEQEILGVTFNDRFVYGVGMDVPFGFWDRAISFKTEVRGHMELSGLRLDTAPIEFTAGFQKIFKSGIIATAGAGGGLNDAIGNPRLRLIASLAYQFQAGNENKESRTLAPGVGEGETPWQGPPPEGIPPMSYTPEKSEPMTPAAPLGGPTDPTRETGQTSASSPSAPPPVAPAPDKSVQKTTPVPTVSAPVPSAPVPPVSPEPLPPTNLGSDPPPPPPVVPVVDEKAVRREAKTQQQALKEAQAREAKIKQDEAKATRAKEVQIKSAEEKAVRDQQKAAKEAAGKERKAKEKSGRPVQDEGRPGESYPAGPMVFPTGPAPTPVPVPEP